MGERKSSLNLKILILIKLCLSVMFFISCGCTSSYRDFIGRDQKYYAEIADACNNLLSQPSSLLDLQAKKVNTYSDVKKWEFKGDEKLMPSVLRDIHATEIIVEMDHVGILIGPERNGFVIAWDKRDYGNGKIQWVLSVNDEGRHTDVYSTEKSLSR